MISRCNKPNKKMLFINQMITTISCLVCTIIWSIFCAPPGAGGFRARGDGSRRWDAFLNHVGVVSGPGNLDAYFGSRRIGMDYEIPVEVLNLSADEKRVMFTPLN